MSKDKKKDEVKKIKTVSKIKDKKVDTKKQETILEVNEITKETVEEQTKKMLEKEKIEKEKADRLRKEKIDKTIKKIFKGYDINELVYFLMWAFLIIVSLYVSINILRNSFSTPALKVFVAEESLQENKRFSIEKVDNIKIYLDSFDVNIRESETEDIVIKYSKKYDKKMKMEKKDKNLTIEEKNKIFKLIRFDSTNNLMIIEIPKNYKGTLEIESNNGSIKIDKYKMFNEEVKVENDKEEFYKYFFNI